MSPGRVGDTEMRSPVSSDSSRVQFPTVQPRYLVAAVVALLLGVGLAVAATTPGAWALAGGVAVGATGIVAVIALPLVVVHLVVEALEH